MAKKQMSREGYEKLEKELAYLVTEKRAEVAQKLKEARSFGDLSENAEYDEAKNEQGILEAQILELQKTLENAEVVDDDCACFLVEAIAQRSQNIKWETTVDKKKVGHKLIRRVSLDQFYALVTGQDDAFYQMCMVLPEVIKNAVAELDGSIVPHDTVVDELKKLAQEQNIPSEDLAIAMAVYMLGFGSYKGFSKK